MAEENGNGAPLPANNYLVPETPEEVRWGQKYWRKLLATKDAIDVIELNLSKIEFIHKEMAEVLAGSDMSGLNQKQRDFCEAICQDLARDQIRLHLRFCNHHGESYSMSFENAGLWEDSPPARQHDA